LGIGLNGHLGFNEEGTDFNSRAHVVTLAPTTRQVMTKYFGDKFNPEFGITQGLGQIMEAKTVILLANGPHKAPILKKALHGSVTPEIPASILQNHPNAYIVIDKEAADELQA
jgi:glucosamine-6-phosphate deaminase